jgi:hypothetical protein
LSFDDLRRLTAGASYEVADGRAKAKVTAGEGGFTFAASCDSLMLLTEELKTEVYHLSTENTALKSELRKTETIEVNRLTPLQGFQIWVGRIALALTVAGVAVRIYKRNKV